MRLLLDEMWPPDAAAQLRRRGHDVSAVAERAELRGKPDVEVFAAAQAEERAIVTENVADFRLLVIGIAQRGQHHFGIVFTSNRGFPRADSRTCGRLVVALDELLRGDVDQTDLEYWL